MAFTQTPIKENIKPTIWQLLLQYKKMIAVILAVILIIIVSINNSSGLGINSQVSTIKHNLKQQGSQNTMLKVDITNQPRMKGDKVSFVHEAHNPLEKKIITHDNDNRANMQQLRERKRQQNRHRKPLSRMKLANIIRNRTYKNGTMMLPKEYFTPLRLNLSHNISYTQYQYNTFDPIRFKSNQTCDYLAVHGLSKSGTTWLQYILKTIANQACFKNEQLSICDKSHIGWWNKHQPVMPIHYQVINVSKLYADNPQLRFCVVAIFRDLRDRIISWTYFHFRKNGDQELDMLQRHILQNTRIFTRELKVWFDFYGNLEMEHPLEYFNVFYEDLVLETQRTVERLVNYVGLNDILDENDVMNITNFIEWDTLKMYKVNTYRSKRSERANICEIENELSAETISIMYTKIENVSLQQEVLRKFNETCAFPRKLFHA